MTISIAAFGAVPHGKMVRRSGAKPGDRVVVTGTIGDAALGLLLRRDPRPASDGASIARGAGHLARRYLVPQPRTAVADADRRPCVARPWTSPTGLPAISTKLCRASGVAAEIEVARVPLSDAARAALGQEARADRDDPHRRRRLRGAC